MNDNVLNNEENILREDTKESNFNINDIEINATLKDYLIISKNFYAGFWLRFIAYIIDLILIASISSIINVITLRYLDFNYSVPVLNETPLYLFVFFGYFIFMTFIFSQTLGKMIVKIKVQSDDGDKLGFLDVVFRELIGKFLNMVFLYIPCFFIVFCNKKKGIHDYIANSVVVKEDFVVLRNKLNKVIKDYK